jgi:hypothetical protein
MTPPLPPILLRNMGIELHIVHEPLGPLVLDTTILAREIMT